MNCVGNPRPLYRWIDGYVTITILIYSNPYIEIDREGGREEDVLSVRGDEN
jgi:hypothetical protein